MNLLRKLIPSAALLVLGLVALLVVAFGAMFMIKAGGSGSWGASAAQDTGGITVKANGQAVFDDTLLATAELPAGPTTFQVSTSSARGDNVLLVRLHEGLTIQQFLHNLAVVNNNAAAGEKDVSNQVDNLGGALVTPQCSVNFTVNVEPGTAYLIHFRGAGISDAHPMVQELRATGPASTAPLPTADQEIVLEKNNGEPRFQASNKLPADGTFRIVNHTDGSNETAFLPLKPGKADSDLSAYFADLSKADWKNAPFSGGPCGLAPMNPGREAVVHLSMTPGSFVLASFAYDAKAKKRNAELGMYQRVTFG